MDTTNTQTFNAWHNYKAGTLEHPTCTDIHLYQLYIH